MREFCGCGAGIRSWSYRRVLEWRAYHHHPGQSEPEKEGAYASVERRPRYFESTSAYGSDIPIVTVKAGFQPN